MPNKILLDNNPFDLPIEDLPCLIHYKKKEGGSFMTMLLISEIYNRVKKVLIFTAHPMAKKMFLENITDPGKVAFIEKSEDIKASQNNQVIIIESGREDLFVSALDNLADINERIILVKNFDIFSPSTLKATMQIEKLILSGNLDNCSIADIIAEKKYDSLIAFSEPKTKIPVDIPKLEKHTGYLWCQSASGITSVAVND